MAERVGAGEGWAPPRRRGALFANSSERRRFPVTRSPQPGQQSDFLSSATQSAHKQGLNVQSAASSSPSCRLFKHSANSSLNLQAPTRPAARDGHHASDAEDMGLSVLSPSHACVCLRMQLPVVGRGWRWAGEGPGAPKWGIQVLSCGIWMWKCCPVSIPSGPAVLMLPQLEHPQHVPPKRRSPKSPRLL